MRGPGSRSECCGKSGMRLTMTPDGAVLVVGGIRFLYAPERRKASGGAIEIDAVLAKRIRGVVLSVAGEGGVRVTVARIPGLADGPWESGAEKGNQR